MTLNISHKSVNETTKHSFTQSIIKIGKDPNSDIILSSGNRMHAVIERDGEKYTIIDLGSETGTIVNGERRNKCTIKTGDNIELGVDVLTVYDASEEQIAEVEKKITKAQNQIKNALDYLKAEPVVFDEFPFTKSKPLINKNHGQKYFSQN